MADNYNKQFILDLEKFADKSINTINDARKFAAYEIFAKVIDRTPIHFEVLEHSGTTKFNWTCTINILSTRVLKGTDKRGDATKKRMESVLNRIEGDDTVYFANSVPWVLVLEEGLYPKNVKKGSYNPVTKKWEILSAGGYSKMAPAGMVKVTLTEYPYIMEKAIKKAQRINV